MRKWNGRLVGVEVDHVRRLVHESRDYVAVGARHIVALAEVEDLGVVEDDSGAPGLADYSTPSAPPPA